MNFIRDRVSAVREVVVENMDGLISAYKNEWVFSKFVPKL